VANPAPNQVREFLCAATWEILRITLQETDTEYLLVIPYQQRERAKTIEGRQWNRDRRCWVFPKKPEIYDSIIAEFGEALQGVVPGPPTAERSTAPTLPSLLEQNQALTEQNQTLRSELIKIQKTLNQIAKQPSSAKKQTTKLRKLEVTLTHSETQIFNLQRELLEAQDTLSKITKEKEHLEQNLQILRDEQSTKMTGISEDDFLQRIIEICREVSGEDEKFLSVLHQARDRASLPIELAKTLASKLREILAAEADVNLYELICQAQNQGFLTRENASLAHTLRTARNIVAHLPTDDTTAHARSLLCLFASAILWRGLPK
jgi:predicted  nucleic acid-binding Zn-ribbon protein